MMSNSSSDPYSSSISGLTGGFNYPLLNFVQSIDEKNACSLIWDQLFAPSLFLGSRSSNPVINVFAF